MTKNDDVMLRSGRTEKFDDLKRVCRRQRYYLKKKRFF